MSVLSKEINHWYIDNKRDLPWRKTKDPYVIWMSEIILQQTKVSQGLPYFERFLDNFPTIESLAQAPEDQVLRLWQGLGYYSRARNMHFTAKYICHSLQNKFPDNYEEIRKLKGVGDYTAAAIASFSYEEKVPVLDGNVFRVVARYFGVFEDISKNSSKKIFLDILNKEIPIEYPSNFNQAMMEFGALQCTPKNPDCFNCVLSAKCYAFKNKKVTELPVKNLKIKKKNRFLNYIILQHQNTFCLKKRQNGEIWEGLYEFLLHEDLESLMPEKYSKEYTYLGIKKIQVFEPNKKHLLSHQNLYSQMVLLEIERKGELDFFTIEDIIQLPKPKLIENFLENYFYKNL